MRLTRVLLAGDLNRGYLDYWPLAKTAWAEIVGVEPMLVLVADPEDAPQELREDVAVTLFPPVEALHSAFQAQCIRLLYPALVNTEGAVLISDLDLLPLRPGYFLDPLAGLDERFFVSYRDTRMDRKEINIMFNAATPATWSEIFDVRSIDDVRRHLAKWGEGLEYDGRRAWPGWYTDQQILYKKLTAWSRRSERLWMLDDQYCGFNRLDRLDLERESGLNAECRKGLATMRYSDYNCLFPYRDYADVTNLILDLALAAVREHGR